MAPDGDGPRRRRLVRWLLGVTVVLAVVGGLGVAWVASRPPTSKLCVGGAPIDERWAATPEAARTRWLTTSDLDVDVARPDRIEVSGDRVTARYGLDAPSPDRSERDEVAFREVVTEQGEDGRWRVVEASRCTEWTT